MTSHAILVTLRRIQSSPLQSFFIVTQDVTNQNVSSPKTAAKEIAQNYDGPQVPHQK